MKFYENYKKKKNRLLLHVSAMSKKGVPGRWDGYLLASILHWFISARPDDEFRLAIVCILVLSRSFHTLDQRFEIGRGRKQKIEF